MSKIAICMCCYNHEKYVAEAIESIIEQTYEDWELWIANDGSTDSSKEVIESFTDKRIHFYNFEKNTCWVGAHTFLLDKIESADCNYLVITDSDDKWKPYRLEKQVAVLDDHPEYAACFSWDEILFEDGSEQDLYRSMTDYSHQKNRSRFEWLRTFGMYDNNMNGCSAMVRREAYFEAGGYNHYFIRMGDYRLWMRIALNHQIFVVQEPLVYYRRHGSNISKVDKNTALGVINEMYMIKKFFLEHISPKDFYRSFYSAMIYSYRNDADDFLADKIFLALSRSEYGEVFRQIAAGIWYEKSDDRSFMTLLNDKYGFENALLKNVSHNSGLGPMLLDSLGYKGVYNFEQINPVNVFLEKYMKEGVGRENINDYTWNAVYMLAAHVMQNGLSTVVLDKLQKELHENRMRMAEEKKVKVMHIIYSEKYADMVIEISSELAGEYEVYVSKVGKEKDVFDIKESSCESFPEEIHYVSIYDKDNSCLYFDEDLGIDSDIIWYIGTLGDEYECRKMMRGYSLGISQMAIIDKNDVKSEQDLSVYEKILDSIDYV